MSMTKKINLQVPIRHMGDLFTWGDEEDTEGTRVGFNSTPWRGGQVRTTVERQMNENGERFT